MHQLKLLIVPTISQRLILGIDFWKAFKLASALVSDLSVRSSDSPSELSLLEDASDSKSVFINNVEMIADNTYPLTPGQSQQLADIIKLFPKFETKG